jgi:hypothetical protein
MLGFFAMMFGFLVVASMISYWISWDLQPKGTRSSFAITGATDLANLLTKCRDAIRNAGSMSAAKSGGATHASARQSLKVTTPAAAAAVNRA